MATKFSIEVYLKEIIQIIKYKNFNKTKLENLKKKIKFCNEQKGKIIFLGNGGSASTCSHASVDLTKNAKIKSINLNEANLITCFSNDYGYSKWMQKGLEFYCDKNDLVVMFSVSGESPNLINAAKWCKQKKINLVTFTGKKKSNSLIKINKKSLNFWVKSSSYNIVEVVHHLWILTIVDMIIEKKNYSV
jgi:D-sedoheptulose 7-phosphate isomerase